MPFEVDDSVSNGGVGDEKDEEEDLEKEERGSSKAFADAGYGYCTLIFPHVFKARQPLCTHTCSSSRFTAVERKALALAKKEPRRDNTSKSCASHQEKSKVQRSALPSSCAVSSAILHPLQ